MPRHGHRWLGDHTPCLGMAPVAQALLWQSPAWCRGETTSPLSWTGFPRWECCRSCARVLGGLSVGRAMGRRARAGPQLLISVGSGMGWGAGLGCQAGREGARSAEPPALCSCISSLAGAASEQTAKARAYGNAYLTGIYIQQCLSVALFSLPNALIPPGSQLGRPGEGGRPWQG